MVRMYDLTLTPKIGLNLYLLAEAGRIVLITMQSVVGLQMTRCLIQLNCISRI